jgi:hypothetical protein
MPLSVGRKLRYIKDRVVNAYWMLRGGKFKLIVHSAYIEVKHRLDVIREWVRQPVQLDDSQVPGSAYTDTHKVLPPSYRPTAAQIMYSEPMRADTNAIALQLEDILTNYEFEKSSDS